VCTAGVFIIKFFAPGSGKTAQQWTSAVFP
jgi:hypothetical protein